METSWKLTLPKFSLAAQKIWVAQNFGGAAAPLAPPARTPMHQAVFQIFFPPIDFSKEIQRAHETWDIYTTPTQTKSGSVIHGAVARNA